MEHIGHFPISMEMCMDDCLTLTTEKTQQKPFQGKASEQSCSTHSISPDLQKNTFLSHAKLPPSMESKPPFPGKQFLQEKEEFTSPNIENMLFFLGNQFLEGKKKSTLETKLKPLVDTLDTDQKSPTSSKDIHKKGRMITATMIGITLGTVNMVTTHILMSVHPQDSFSKKLDQLRKSTVQGNQLTRLSRYTSTGFPCDKKNLQTDLHESWNHRETLSIESRITAMMNNTMSTIHMILMSEHSSDSISNRLAPPGKNTSQKKYITRLEGHNNIDQLCDRENLLTDLPESWPYRESLHNKSRLIGYGDICRYVHKEFYILPRPSKAMTQWKFQHTQREVYILSRPSKLQPMANHSIASPLLPQLLSILGAQEMYQYTHKELYIISEPILVKQTLVQHRPNTSWKPATVVSQCTSNSYWIMQENGTDQPKVYRRTRTMLKIRCTDFRQTRHSNSRSTESEKAEFHTPAIPNMTRNCVEHSSVENISQDLVQPNTSDTEASASFDFKSEEREEITEIADVPAPALERIEEQSSHTPGSRKTTRKNFGKPASSFSDFYM